MIGCRVDGAAAHVPPETGCRRGAQRRPFNVRVQYGFMEDPDVPEALAQARKQGLVMDSDDLTYFLGRENDIVKRSKGRRVA